MDQLAHESVIERGNEWVSQNLCASCAAKWTGFQL